MHYYQFHIGDYLKDTNHLTDDEDLTYRRLLDIYYDGDGPIPNEIRKISRRIRRNEADVKTVLDEFFELKDDGWHSGRCDEEIAKYRAMRDGGRKGAQRRWDKEAIAPVNEDGNRGAIGGASPTQTPPNANQEPRTNNQEPINTSIERGQARTQKDLPIPYRYPTDTVSIPYAEREEEGEEEREGEPLRESPDIAGKNNSSPLPKSFLDSPYREEAERFSDWFAESLKPATLKGSKSERDQWALVWYHLRSTDKRENAAEMAQAIAWARGDPFWSKNFISPTKLRIRDKQGQMYIDRFIAEHHQHKTGGQNGHKRGITPDQLKGIFDWIDSNPAIPA